MSSTYPAVFVASGRRFKLWRFLVALPALRYPRPCGNWVLAPHRAFRQDSLGDPIRRNNHFGLVGRQCAVVLEEHVAKLAVVVHELEGSFVEAILCQFLICRTQRIGVSTSMVGDSDPTHFSSLASSPHFALVFRDRGELAAFESLRISGLWAKTAGTHRHVRARTASNPTRVEAGGTPGGTPWVKCQTRLNLRIEIHRGEGRIHNRGVLAL